MKKRISPALVGIFVVSAIMLGVVAIVTIGSGRLFRQTATFVSYFEGSVRGLQVGSTVSFMGVPVGSVKEVLISLDEGETTAGEVRIPVIYEIDQTLLTRRGATVDLTDPNEIQSLFDRGVSARLETESLVTGRLYIALAFRPDEPLFPFASESRYTEIPSVRSPLAEVGAKLTELVDRLADQDLGLLVASLRETVDGINALVRNSEMPNLIGSVEGVMGEVEETLRVFRQLALAADSAVAPIQDRFMDASDRLADASDRAEATLAAVDSTLATMRGVMDPRAPLAMGFVNALRELELAASAMRRVAEMIERNPSVLIRGRPSGGK